MRTYEFRAWLLKEKRYIRVARIDFSDGTLKDTIFGNEFYDFNDLILEQFTGLYDKNGVKIFEGDIVKTYEPFNIPQVAEIKFNDGCFDVIGITLTFRDYLKCFVANKAIEVIGNIHERSEKNDE